MKNHLLYIFKKKDMLLYVWIFLLITASFVRMVFGIELTDEAYYVSEVISVLKGNVLYAYSSSKPAGMTILVLPLFALFRVFSQSYDGIILFSRMTFICFQLGILAIGFFLLRKEKNVKILLLALSIMVPYWGERIPNFSYNTISLYLLFLTGILQFRALSFKPGTKRDICVFFSGVLVAFAEFAHPGQIINTLWFGIVLLILGKETKWRLLMFYLLGGLTILISVLGTILCLSGFEKLADGIKAILTRYSSAQKPVGFFHNIFLYISTYRSSFFFYFLACITAGIYLFVKKRGKPIVSILFIIDLSNACALLISIVFILIRRSMADWMMCLGAALSICVFFCILTGLWDQTRQKQDLLFLVFPFFMFVVNGFFTSTGVVSRAIYFTICGFGIATHFLEGPLKNYRIYKKLIIALLFLLTVFGIVADYGYLYREDSVVQLTEHVDTGIYQGLYTTPEKAEAVESLESYLQENTAPDMPILFLDQAAFGYLMTDCFPCAPSTWDQTHYHKGNNFPEPLLSYFIRKETTPEKIIYIDFGRDMELSIETEDYLFNDYVNRHYKYSDSNTIGNLFRVLIYTRKD